MDGSRHGMDRSVHGSMDRSSHGMDRSCHVVGFQLEPSAREERPDGAQGSEGRTTEGSEGRTTEGSEGRTTAPLTSLTTGAAASEDSHGHSSARPASWLRLATDDPENQFHEIFTFEDDDCRAPLKQDSSRLLILTAIEGGQHKQPPLFKRHGTACNHLEAATTC